MLMALDGSLLPSVVDAKIAISSPPLPSIGYLFSRGRPLAIRGRVIAVIIDTVYRPVRCVIRTTFNPLPEAIERLPFRTNLDPSSPVVFPVDGARIRATDFHTRPYAE